MDFEIPACLRDLKHSDRHLKGEEHLAFMIEWRAQNLPENLPQTGGWA
jgi:hypothetical protein